MSSPASTPQRAERAASASPSDAGLPLTRLGPGTRGVVVSVDDAHPVGRRLLDLGFIPETEVTVVRRAPLGDPVVYAVRSTKICLRRGEAARITVRRCESGE